MPLVGRYATSMEMAGRSLTLCRLDGELERLLTAPCDCAFWKVCDGRRDRHPATVTVADLHAGLDRVARGDGARAPTELNAADGALGDGDLGVTMTRGMACRGSRRRELPDDLGLALLRCAQAFTRVVLVLRHAARHRPDGGGKATKGRTAIDRTEIPGLRRRCLAAMMARGKGALGDKTVLDGLDAISAAMREAPSDEYYKRALAAARSTLEPSATSPTARPRAHVRREEHRALRSGPVGAGAHRGGAGN